ncbi:hypothetical protein [Paraburkholderia kirstenboschensis]|uniref:Uncharacterized protein n=1 Tax=Paraburkholderia kirstenboschensis TaxID=1245436 RepID=A0ABZ0EN58_9BURK|nr:hypothetical protein [Paraburkholderia kirstenboschensis]WOD18596.1 hypothetical protein RW095_38425 [Paraburkholderia kirstenboschensis]
MDEPPAVSDPRSNVDRAMGRSACGAGRSADELGHLAHQWARILIKDGNASVTKEIGRRAALLGLVQDDGSAHRMVPGFRYALTDEGKKAYRSRADPPKDSKICGGKARLVGITFATDDGHDRRLCLAYKCHRPGFVDFE